VLLAEMALRGPWVSVPAPVFLHREHPHRYTRALLLKDRREAALWQDSSAAAQRATTQFHLNVWRHYWRAVARSVADPEARRACEVELFRWWLTDGHAADVARDLARAASPRLLAVLGGAKRALFGRGRRETTPPGALPPVA
jgi:hypothetical protein